MRSLHLIPVVLTLFAGAPAGFPQGADTGVPGTAVRSGTRAPAAAVDGRLPQSTKAAPAEQIGGRSARIVIEEYSDFQCPYCAEHEKQYAAATAVWVVRQKGRVRFDFYDVALPRHGFAAPAARAARCAGAQGRYAAARHAIFLAQEDWAHGADAPARVAAIARATVKDPARFDRCLVSDTVGVNQVLAANLQRGRDLRIPGTPTFVVNVPGKRAQVVDPVSPDSLEKVIRSLETGR